MSTKMTDTTPAAPKSTGIKKLNLGGIAQKSEKSGKEYPSLPDPDGQVAQLVEAITDHIYGRLRELNQLWRSPFYEGIVMKRADSSYPIQTRSATEEFAGWVKHRFLN